MEASLVLGEDPAKAWNTNTLKQSTLHAVYDELMNSMFNTAQDHVNISDALTSQVVEVLRSVGKKSEDSRKMVPSYFCRVWNFFSAEIHFVAGNALLSEDS